MIQDFRLTVFITVARTLSFTRAAALLNVSQPAISKHIKELEILFCEPLFNRQGNKITLTEKAKEIVPKVEDIIEAYHAIEMCITEEKRGFEGGLHIGASTTIAHYVLPTILAKFKEKYPNIRISMESGNSDQMIQMLQRKEIEVALIEGDSVDSAIHYTEFAADKIVLVSTKRDGGQITVPQLQRLPLLIREEGSGTLSVIMNALRTKGLSRKQLNINMQLGSSEAIIRYLKASSDYAFLSILVAKEQIERNELTITNVKGLEIERKLRFATLHGQSGRFISLFQQFCIDNYNF